MVFQRIFGLADFKSGKNKFLEMVIDFYAGVTGIEDDVADELKAMLGGGFRGKVFLEVLERDFHISADESHIIFTM